MTDAEKILAEATFDKTRLPKIKNSESYERYWIDGAVMENRRVLPIIKLLIKDRERLIAALRGCHGCWDDGDKEMHTVDRALAQSAQTYDEILNNKGEVK